MKIPQIDQIHRMLYHLFLTAMNDDSDVTDYGDVDFFYAYLGYDIQIQPLMLDIGIEGTSDLQEVLLKEHLAHNE